MTQLRTHQAELAEKIRDKEQRHLPLSILAWVVPGGGKSWLPGIVAQQFPAMKVAWFVPRKALQHQAALGMLNDFKMRVWESENDVNPSRGERGFIATHQGLAANPELYAHELRRHPYILVIDEIHHAKIDPGGELNATAAALQQLASYARVTLMMTGTLETNDRSAIWGIEYNESPSGQIVAPARSADIYVRYDRPTALSENAIVPIEFYHHDGPTKYINREGEQRTVLSQAATRKEESEALFTALRTEIADELFRLGMDHWKEHGGKLIVVAAYQSDATRIHKAILKTGNDSSLAIVDEGPDALEAIKRFKEGSCRVLVTCAMAYEGLDVPAASHLICLTHIRSIPWIEQMLARIWRSHPGKTKCWAFVPDDPRMKRVIEAIRIERLSVLGEVADREGNDGKSGERFPLVAVESEVASIRSEMLDGEMASEIIRSQVIEAFRGLGLSEDDPLIEQVVKKTVAARTHGTPKATAALTTSEEAKRIRKGIYGMCVGADRDRGKAFGFHGKELFRRTQISFDAATLEQLKNVIAPAATQLCS